MADPLFDNVTLTTNYADNQKQSKVDNNNLLSLIVDYQKGDESSMEMRVEFSSIKDDDGSEVWARVADDRDQGAGIGFHKIDPYDYQFDSSGQYRIQILASKREDEVRVSVKRTGGTGTGTATVFLYRDQLFQG